MIMKYEKTFYETFQTKGKELLEQLVIGSESKIVKDNDTSLTIKAKKISIRLYLYLSHKPVVNLSIIPTGEEWNELKNKSLWRDDGIWLADLIAYKNPKIKVPDTHFKTNEELEQAIKILVDLLHTYGADILNGEISILKKILDDSETA